MIFFRPTMKWIDWLIGYANGRIIVDIGCGEGYLLHKLYNNSYKRLIGVDLYIDDQLRLDMPDIHLLEMDTVLNGRILRGLSGDKCLFLFCRPCHGHFVSGTLENLADNVTILYVGKPDNLTIDIPEEYTAELVESPALREEQTYMLARMRQS